MNQGRPTERSFPSIPYAFYCSGGTDSLNKQPLTALLPIEVEL